jgi:dienelactone hydrolase
LNSACFSVLSWLIRLAFVAALVAPVAAQELAADLNEAVTKIPAAGVEMVVTTFKPNGDGPFPLVIINHGRAGTAVERAKVRRQRYPDAARYFVRRGFAVVVPTRKGYGETGGSDPENSGACVNPSYAPTFDAALESIVPVLEWAKRLPYFDARRILAVGTSMGGISTIALAARNPEGMVLAVNFAGGKGGDPATRPGDPCAPDKLAQSYAAFGKSARVPTLWLYSQNDLYWGAELPRQWHKAYVDAGGPAEFVSLPAFGRDGHLVFGQGVSLWAPHVDAFLKEHGLLPAAGAK